MKIESQENVRCGKVIRSEVQTGKSGYGFVQIDRVGRVYFRFNRYAVVECQTVIGVLGGPSEVFFEALPRGYAVASLNEEIVLEVEPSDRGPRAKWWAYKSGWEKAIERYEMLKPAIEKELSAQRLLAESRRQVAAPCSEPAPVTFSPTLSKPQIGEEWWVVSDIYFCLSEGDAQIIQAVREAGEFDYAFGWDFHHDGDPVITSRIITEQDEPMHTTETQLAIEDLREMILAIAGEGEFEEEIRLIEERLQGGQTHMSFFFIEGE